MPMLLVLLLTTFSRTPPALTWSDFFASVRAGGITYSDVAKHLDGHRVRLRGYSVGNPAIRDGVLLTHFPHEDPHEVEETDVPYDAVAVIWKKGVDIPRVPTRPTVEGVLRLGNRDVGPVIVSITLEDATPVLPDTENLKY
jgi:hypothetical protein